MAVSVKNLDSREFFFGHKACAGCGGSLAVRIALKVLGARAVAVLPAGCMSAVGFNFPQLAFSNNALITPFAATASVMTGIEAGLRRRGEIAHVVGFAGDGGTADIGLQALSGAIDRGDNLIYICYDNEAYMNTGIQKSGLTPFGARTTTTPITGSVRRKKDMLAIVAANGAEYAASASVGYLDDYVTKIEKAAAKPGFKYIHVIAPCPTGWGIKTNETIEIAREAVDVGLWRLREYENGQWLENCAPSRPEDLVKHLTRQGRFSALDTDKLEETKNV
ncbi:MAG: pyruvate synthase subunit beta [Oscillospiraceae bacterium]|jgi:pyruvate ferredoxin oxidoreductase beta subunit|nr:pyruvate synthase subunit beta [Oscillospiraceae bacterium]